MSFSYSARRGLKETLNLYQPHMDTYKSLYKLTWLQDFLNLRIFRFSSLYGISLTS